jgi:hypothetical protein
VYCIFALYLNIVKFKGCELSEVYMMYIISVSKQDKCHENIKNHAQNTALSTYAGTNEWNPK